jgi:hypothetical protein
MELLLACESDPYLFGAFCLVQVLVAPNYEYDTRNFES